MFKQTNSRISKGLFSVEWCSRKMKCLDTVYKPVIKRDVKSQIWNVPGRWPSYTNSKIVLNFRKRGIYFISTITLFLFLSLRQKMFSIYSRRVQFKAINRLQKDIFPHKVLLQTTEDPIFQEWFKSPFRF